MKLAFLIPVLAMASCQPSPNQALKSVEYMCVSATALLSAASALNDKLDAEDRGHVTHAVSVISPICSQQAVPTLTSTAEAAMQSALAELTAAVQQ